MSIKKGVYDKYLSFIDSNEYEEYMNLLKMFYNKNPKQQCPKCKKAEIIKTKKDNILEMKCQSSKCVWQVKIIVSKTENIVEKFKEGDRKKTELLYKLIYTDQFNKIKEEYLELEKQLVTINDIFDNQTIELNKLEKDRIELTNKSLITYYHRQELFEKLKNIMVPDLRNTLVKIYKNEGKNLSETRVKQLSKQYKVEMEDIKNILSWLDKSKEYIDLQLKLESNNEKIKTLKKNINIVNKNFMIQLPSVLEGKSGKELIKVKQNIERENKQKEKERQELLEKEKELINMTEEDKKEEDIFNKEFKTVRVPKEFMSTRYDELTQKDEKDEKILKEQEEINEKEKAEKDDEKISKDEKKEKDEKVDKMIKKESVKKEIPSLPKKKIIKKKK